MPWLRLPSRRSACLPDMVVRMIERSADNQRRNETQRCFGWEAAGVVVLRLTVEVGPEDSRPGRGVRVPKPLSHPLLDRWPEPCCQRSGLCGWGQGGRDGSICTAASAHEFRLPTMAKRRGCSIEYESSSDPVAEHGGKGDCDLDRQVACKTVARTVSRPPIPRHTQRQS